MNLGVYRNLRIVGVEDGSFQRDSAETVLVAVLFHGLWLRDVQFKSIVVDGFDATKRLLEMLGEWQFDLVMLAGLSFAGFNVIDPRTIFQSFHKPVIVVCGRKPNNVAVKRALQRHFIDWRRRWKIFENAFPIYLLRDAPKVYVELVGLDVKHANKILSEVTLFGKTPEPIRVARIIARGVSKFSRNR